jgi:ribosome-binding ATPase YchF (GTP1/OBG family)
MWYLRLIEKGWERFARQVNQEKPELNKAVAKQLSSFRVTENLMKKVMEKLSLSLDIMKWDRNTLLKIATELRKETKPMLIACNKMDVKGADDNFERLKKEFPGHILVPCSAESELALREAAKHELVKYIPGDSDFEIIHEEKLNDKQKTALNFIKTEMLDKFASTGVQKVLDIAVFELLKFIAAYPVATNKLTDKEGRTLPDCLLVPNDTTALDFAFKVHTDIGNNFIKAIDQKTRLVVGKYHILRDRDVIEIVTSK